MADLVDPEVVLIGLAIVQRPEGEVYVWSFKIGTETRYLKQLLAHFEEDRMKICRHAFFALLLTLYDAGISPTAIYLYRLTDFANTTQQMMDEEIDGIERAIAYYYVFRPGPIPIKAVISVTEGPYEWSDFAIPAGDEDGDTDISYWVIQWPIGIVNMDFIKKLTLAHSFTSGLLRLCWKAKNYFALGFFGIRAEQILAGPNINNGHRAARSLLENINFFQFGPI